MKIELLLETSTGKINLTRKFGNTLPLSVKGCSDAEHGEHSVSMYGHREQFLITLPVLCQ